MRIRQHVNPLRLEYSAPHGRAIELPVGREVEVELGCADAQFLFERARLDPARVEIGLEIRAELVVEVNAKASAVGAKVTAYYTNIQTELGYLFAPGSIARLFVNFPDPWFKKRHHKRRLVTEELVAACQTVLARGGELFFQSDVFEVALEAMAVLEAHSGEFVNRAGPWSFWKAGNPYGARSRREEACAAEGLPVWRLMYEARQGSLAHRQLDPREVL